MQFLFNQSVQYRAHAIVPVQEEDGSFWAQVYFYDGALGNQTECFPTMDEAIAAGKVLVDESINLLIKDDAVPSHYPALVGAIAAR